MVFVELRQRANPVRPQEFVFVEHLCQDLAQTLGGSRRWAFAREFCYQNVARRMLKMLTQLAPAVASCGTA